MKKLPALLATTLLTACAALPTQDELATADYGRDMSAEECATVSESLIANTLKDPGSAQFRRGQCFKGAFNSVPLMGMPKAYGWIQQGEVNAKNSYGGYVGFRPYQVLMKDGQPVRYCINSDRGVCMPVGL